MKNKIMDFNALNDDQKTNYVKNVLFNNEINAGLDNLLKNEKKNMETLKIILKVVEDELILNRIKEQCNLTGNVNLKAFIYSRIIATLSFYNKSVILNSFFKLLSEEDIKRIAFYEYQNKTDISFSNKTFNKYCSKYKDEALESLNLDDTEVLMLDEVKERYNALQDKKVKNKRKGIPILIFCVLVLVFGIIGYKIYDYSRMISKYDGLFYPGIYLNNVDLTGMKVSNITTVIEKEKKRIQNGTITVTNVNGDYKFTYEEIGILADDTNLEKKIKNYNNGLSFVEKIKFIKSGKKNKTFYMKASYNDSVDNFVSMLSEKLNSVARNDGMIVDANHNVYYDEGANGFTLDTVKTKRKVTEALSNLKEETVIEAEGVVIKNEIRYKSLSSINKKVSTYTTYFANAGNRGHNINLASSRLNNTILMPGETFSYLKVVGPYGASNGYLPAPIYLNGDTATANGGGVCQLASTLYNAQLRAGLITVSRRGHTFAPNYVPKGLDATVYSTTTDFKFKNQYEYPVYIVSYVKGNYLTVDIWTNENALGGKTYEPYSVPSNGGWLAYLKTIENGKVIETKYLDRSVYKAH